jgi:hypothetical protein
LQVKTITTRDSDKMFCHCIDREPFNTHGEMHGNKVNWHSAYMALSRPGCRLPSKYHDSFMNAEYAVYSYNTPIAWYGPDGWTFPEEKYSATTSRHQGRLYFIHKWIKE